jgi:hypothetical protein
MAIGSVLWGALAERAGLEKALLASAVGIAACLLLRCPFRCWNPPRLWMYGITGQDPQVRGARLKGNRLFRSRQRRLPVAVLGLERRLSLQRAEPGGPETYLDDFGV